MHHAYKLLVFKIYPNHKKITNSVNEPSPEGYLHSVFTDLNEGLRPATLFKKRCFPVNFVKFLRTPILKNTSGRLLLKDEPVKFHNRTEQRYL